MLKKFCGKTHDKFLDKNSKCHANKIAAGLQYALKSIAGSNRLGLVYLSICIYIYVNIYIEI